MNYQTTKRHLRTEKREEEESGGVMRDTTLGGVRNYITGFTGSQAVPIRPSGRGNAYDRNSFYMTLEGLH
jgi:hypothetical protein